MNIQLLEEIESIGSTSNLSDIYQKMIKDFYPKVKNINSRIAVDLGLLYIYRNLDDEDEKNELVKFWKTISPPEILHLPVGEFHYRPYVDFINIDNIMNGLYIEKILEQLKKFANLTFQETCAILSDIERYHIVPLSEMDVKIIETIKSFLKENLEFNNDLLAEKLDVRANYISRRMGYLRNNAYFRITGTVNFPKIGLRQYIILIESSLTHRDSLPEFFQSPYTRTIRRCPNHRFDYIVSLTLPKNLEKTLFEYLKKLNDNEVIRCFYCDEVKSIANNLDFTYYSYSKRPTVLSGNKPGFQIDWFKERVYTMPNNNRKSENFFHKFEFKGKKVDVKKRDLKVLTFYRRDMQASVRTVAKRLALSWDEANYHIEKTSNLLFPMILLYYTGLNQTALLFFENITTENLEKLEILLSRMPQSFTYTFKNGGTIITVDLMNGANRLNDLICESLPELKTAQFTLASKTTGIFRPIPYRYYDEKDKEWFFPKDFFLFKELK